MESSIFKEINKEVQKARIQAFTAASKFGFEIRSHETLHIFLKTPEVLTPAGNCAVLNGTECLHEYCRYNNGSTKQGLKQIVIGDRLAYVKVSSEWMKVNFVNVLNYDTLLLDYAVNKANIEEIIVKINSRIINNSQYLTSLTQEQLLYLQKETQKCLPYNSADTQNESISYDADLNINEVIEAFLDPDYLKKRERNKMLFNFFEHNIWFKLFYYARHIYGSLSPQEKNNLLKVFHDKMNIFDKLKMFGYNLLLYDNENIDYYSFKLIQDVCKDIENISHDPDSLQTHMAMEFFGSNFVENVIQACDETFYSTGRRRMNYTRMLHRHSNN